MYAVHYVRNLVAALRLTHEHTATAGCLQVSLVNMLSRSTSGVKSGTSSPAHANQLASSSSGGQRGSVSLSDAAALLALTSGSVSISNSTRAPGDSPSTQLQRLSGSTSSVYAAVTSNGSSSGAGGSSRGHNRVLAYDDSDDD
jgi:hypothetical protein